MHALQRVQRSRSIGFSCAHAASNAPSQPESFVSAARVDGEFALRRKLRAGRASGEQDGHAELRRTAARPVQCRLGGTDDQHAAFGAVRRRAAPARARAAPRARAARRSWAWPPCASADQPPVSRMLTKRIVCALPPSSATSPKSRASCVHATTTSPRRLIGERRELLLAEHRLHGGCARKLERARERLRVERHRRRCTSKDGGSCRRDSSRLGVHLVGSLRPAAVAPGSRSARTSMRRRRPPAAPAAWRCRRLRRPARAARPRRRAASASSAASSSAGTSSTKPCALIRVGGGSKM